MLADKYLPVVMQLCYFLGHKNENEAQNFGISKDWLRFDSTDLNTKGLSNILADLGIQTNIVDNPIKSSPPFLIGSRMESPEFKTILIYGHGDTVPLQVEEWHEGISPSELKIIDDKIYGRVSGQ